MARSPRQQSSNMNWKSLGKGVVDSAVNVATNKATGTAASFVVNKFGPQRMFQKFGYGFAGLGVLLVLIALIFGQLKLLLLTLGALSIGFGIGLYLLNGLLISLASSLIKRVSTSLWKRYFAQQSQQP